MVVRGLVCFTETFSEVQFRPHAGPGCCPLFNRRTHLGAPHPPAPLLATTPPPSRRLPLTTQRSGSLVSSIDADDGQWKLPKRGSQAPRQGRAGSFGFAEKSFKSKPFRERDRGVSRRKGLHHRQNSGLSSQVRKKTPFASNGFVSFVCFFKCLTYRNGLTA